MIELDFCGFMPDIALNVAFSIQGYQIDLIRKKIPPFIERNSNRNDYIIQKLEPGEPDAVSLSIGSVDELKTENKKTKTSVLAGGLAAAAMAPFNAEAATLDQLTWTMHNVPDQYSL